MEKKPLESRADLMALLEEFYDRVRRDDLIGPVFEEKAKVNWHEHIPKICDFWESLLFGSNNYSGRPFPPHLPLDLKPEHFRRWLQLFFGTVDQKFHGNKADEIKVRAFNIGNTFLGRINTLRS